MAKKDLKVAPTVETLKPYLDRALNDKDFREDLKEALSAAKKLYGPLVKDAKGDGAVKSASRLATDAKVQENLRKALEDFGKAAGALKGKKKSRKGRNAMLLAGLIAGALYNPWSGPQTRDSDFGAASHRRLTCSSSSRTPSAASAITSTSANRLKTSCSGLTAGQSWST